MSRSEDILIECMPELPPGQFWTISFGRGSLAAVTGRRHSSTQIHCQFLDLYPLEESRRLHGSLPNLELFCSADLPEGPFDAVAIPVRRDGESELARELIQEAWHRLHIGGQLFAAVDNPGDSFLLDELKDYQRNISRHVTAEGVFYRLIKDKPHRKRRDFRCEFAFRDRGRLIKAVSRPGVFSHRRLDLGARALIDMMEISDGARVLDLGCGAGVVGFAAACRGSSIHVHAVDSNVRAIQCTQEGASLNELTTLTAQLNADGHVDDPGTFDVVAANPPYYSNYKIAQIFLDASHTALRRGGMLFLVTRNPDWFQTEMANHFRDVTVRPSRVYFIVSGRKR